MLFLAPGVPGVAFTARLGGGSSGPYASLNLSDAHGDDPARVRENRRAVSQALGIPERWATARQVHGARLVVAEAAGNGPLAAADAVVTRRPGLPAAVLTADCVPVALAARGAVAAVHAGWRGLCSGVVEAAVAAVGKGAAAWIGPSIGPCHYEVGDEVVARFRARYPEAPEVWGRAGGKLRFDLRAAALWLLERAGAAVASGEDPPCTACDPRFYSYRREGITGRQALVVWREPKRRG